MGVNKKVDLTVQQLEVILSLLRSYLPETIVWAFGSRVKFTSPPESDLDLVAFIAPEQKSHLAALKEALDESGLPFQVDLIDWNGLPENFKKNIEKEYIVLCGEGDDADKKIGWKRYKLRELLEIPMQNGLTKSIGIRGTGIKMVNVGEMFSFHRIKNIPMERVPISQNELKQFALKPGDLLFAWAPILKGAGRCSIFLFDDEQVIFGNHLIRVPLIRNLLIQILFTIFFNQTVPIHC